MSGKKSPANTILLVLFFVLLNTLGNAQIITTIAGNGIAAYAGDGGPATMASFNLAGIVFDATGNLYIGDGVNNRLRIIDTSGIVHTFAGTGTAGFFGDGGPATAALLNNAVAVIIDHVGNIYFSDFNNHRIRKVAPSGIITTIAGNGIAGNTGDGGPATDAELNLASCVATDASGNIYVSTDERRVRKIDPSGLITDFAGTATFGYWGDGGPATDAGLKFPGGFAADALGNIYIADMQNNRIRKVDPMGIITTFAGTGTTGFSPDGTPASAAQFNYPDALYIDGLGNIYFTDINNYRVRKITPDGILHTVVGNGIMGSIGTGGPATAAEIGGACALAFDCAGNLYLTDPGNNRVSKITYDLPPAFTGGHSQSLTVCKDTLLAPINALLAVVDTHAGKTETWQVVSAPAHGTVVGSYTATSTGSIITPTGLSYTPASGYTGPDSFSIQVKDCSPAYTSSVYVTTIHVTVNNCGALWASSLPSPGEQGVLTVSPNPNEGSLSCMLSSGLSEEVQVVITNIIGGHVKEFSTTTNTKTDIQLSVPAGIYFLSASTRDKTYNAKVVVSK